MRKKESIEVCKLTKRKRLTQLFPFLLPLRKWQRKKFFYLKMKFDGNKYAEKTTEKLLPYTVFETASLMYINRCEIGYELPDNTKYEERGV